MGKKHKPNFKKTKDSQKDNNNQSNRNNNREEFAQEQDIELYEQDVCKLDDKGNQC